METAPLKNRTTALKEEDGEINIKRKTRRENKKKLSKEDEEIVVSLGNVAKELSFAYRSFELARDEALIDSFIFEIMSLNKRYEYYIRLCRERGLVAEGFADGRRIHARSK